jgi:hypothetical protein
VEKIRLSEIISDNIPAITAEWLEAAKKDPEILPSR